MSGKVLGYVLARVCVQDTGIARHYFRGVSTKDVCWLHIHDFHTDPNLATQFSDYETVKEFIDSILDFLQSSDDLKAKRVFGMETEYMVMPITLGGAVYTSHLDD